MNLEGAGKSVHLGQKRLKLTTRHLCKLKGIKYQEPPIISYVFSKSPIEMLNSAGNPMEKNRLLHFFKYHSDPSIQILKSLKLAWLQWRLQ